MTGHLMKLISDLLALRRAGTNVRDITARTKSIMWTDMTVAKARVIMEKDMTVRETVTTERDTPTKTMVIPEREKTTTGCGTIARIMIVKKRVMMQKVETTVERFIVEWPRATMKTDKVRAMGRVTERSTVTVRDNLFRY